MTASRTIPTNFVRLVQNKPWRSKDVLPLMHFGYEPRLNMTRPMPFSKKLRITVGAGALPGTAIAALGDFFSPKGGWILPLALGILCSVLLIALLLIGTEVPKKLSSDDEALDGWWDGPRHKQVGIWTLFAMAFAGLTVGAFSYAKSDKGGVLGSKIEIVGDAQRLTGLIEKGVEQQGRIVDATEGIQKTVKRETSENPRKELANLGQPWNTDGFHKAILRDDRQSIDLYLAGGMTAPSYDGFVLSVIKDRHYAALDIFENYDLKASPKSCRLALHYHDIFAVNPDDNNATNSSGRLRKGGAKIDDQAARAFKALCGSYQGLVASVLEDGNCKASKSYSAAEYRFCTALKKRLN